jgi:UDP-N-acetylmuramyl-tripeptide synthetase
VSQRFETAQDVAGWLKSQGVVNLHSDSRLIQAGDAFIAWPGTTHDGRQFVAGALAAGAAACVVSAQGIEQFEFSDVRVAVCESLKTLAGPIASGFYGHPSHALDIVAITGTNGKTSSAWWIPQMLSSSEHDSSAKHEQPEVLAEKNRICSMVGTLGIGIPPQAVPTGLTTPDPVLLQRNFRAMCDSGVSACAVEASSIGIAEHRLDATQIKVALFTNLTQDHLDYHGTMAAYWDCKRALFAWPSLQSAVVNVDDPYGQQLAQTLRASNDSNNIDLWTFSCNPLAHGARLLAQNITHSPNGLQFDVVEGGQQATVTSTAIGAFNVANLLGCIGVTRALGMSLDAAALAVASLQPVPGRLEAIGASSVPLVVVDYAHTPDALAKALAAVRPVAAARGGHLYCVFGCGGDRDASKRPLMGQVAADQADWVVLTSDNPRSESPSAILADICAGIGPQRPTVSVQLDRELAIANTILAANATDVVLIAGKGHETTQEIAGVKHVFSDQVHARAAQAKWTPTLTKAYA